MEPFLGEVCLFAFDHVPKGWARCDGQILPVAQNTALYALLGTTYGGDGKDNFALPDIRGKAVIHPGKGEGLTERTLGESGGEPAVRLKGTEVPLAHGHTVSGLNNHTGQNVPGPTVGLNRSVNGNAYVTDVNTNQVRLAAGAVGPSTPAPGAGPHNNLQPSLVLTYCIALKGSFPARP